MIRSDLLNLLTTRISAVSLPHPTRVGIDGIDTAGKTVLADELAGCIDSGPVIRASVDRFHNPRSVRYRLGPDAPEGYYADSFDLSALRTRLLDPLGPDGSRWIVTERFDFRADAPAAAAPFQADPQAVLLFDGIFLHRPELRGCFDLTIYLSISYETMLARALLRDGGGPETLDRYRRRYIPAQQHYLDACRPDQQAAIVIDNNDPANPTILRM